jgi:hypothetical protein
VVKHFQYFSKGSFVDGGDYLIAISNMVANLITVEITMVTSKLLLGNPVIICTVILLFALRQQLIVIWLVYIIPLAKLGTVMMSSNAARTVFIQLKH